MLRIRIASRSATGSIAVHQLLLVERDEEAVDVSECTRTAPAGAVGKYKSPTGAYLSRSLSGAIIPLSGFVLFP
jgi:hypothetical protein